MEERVSSQNDNVITPRQRRTLEKIRNRKKPVRSNRATARARRTTFVQSPLGIHPRRELIKIAIKELRASKRQVFPQKQKGKRISKKVTSIDVQGWLCIEKKLSFSERTIAEDLRRIREQNT